MDLNTIFFGVLAIFSFAVFFYLGKMKASKSQTEREDRIDWSGRKFSFRSCITVALAFFLILYFLNFFILS
tara:strand:+ start:180 stop:392 length:213 start_codon:yes stop_codon:yes gene_type:complete